MILIIDNYDSFTYNLLQYVGEITEQAIPLEVYRNDQLSLEEIKKKKPTHIIISPGPCTPNESGISLEIIANLYKEIPILGVCLGHQAIAQVFGGKVIRAPLPVHGKTSEIFHNQKGLFKGISFPLTATRYHSLIADKDTFPACLEITAQTKDGIIMALTHKDYPGLVGVQFHPESIMTPDGKTILNNFLIIS